MDSEAVDMILETAHHKPGSWAGMVAGGGKNGIHGGHHAVEVVLVRQRMLLLQRRRSSVELGRMPVVVVVGILGVLVGMLGVVAGILGVLAGILGVLVGMLGVVVGILGVLVGMLGVVVVAGVGHTRQTGHRPVEGPGKEEPGAENPHNPKADILGAQMRMLCSFHHDPHISVRRIPQKRSLVLRALSLCPLPSPLSLVSSGLSGVFCVPSSLPYTHRRFVLPRTCCDTYATLCRCDGFAPLLPHSRNCGGGGALAIAKTNDACLSPYPGEQPFNFFLVGRFMKVSGSSRRPTRLKVRNVL